MPDRIRRRKFGKKQGRRHKDHRLRKMDRRRPSKAYPSGYRQVSRLRFLSMLPSAYP
jgi:hypothetical protein